MTSFALTPRSIFGPGIKPPKAQIIQYLERLEQSVGAGIVVRGTVAALGEVIPENEDAGAWVLNDPDPANNGYYYRDSGTWVKGRGFPDSFTVFEQTGGTANALQLTAAAGVNPGDIVAGLLVPDASNTGATTIAINGDAAVPLLSAAGSPLAAGEFVAGKATIIATIGNDWRVILAFSQFSFRKAWDSATTYVADDIVESGGALWLALTSNTNVTPAEGDDWTLFLPGVTVADGSVTEAKYATGSVSARAVSDDADEQAAIAYKIGAVSTDTQDIYVDATLGDDTIGDGSEAAPYATPQKAWDSLPFNVLNQVTIHIANGTYAISSRAASEMQRPALLHLDMKKMGKRTDRPGGVMVGSVVFKGESKAGVIFQPGSANGLIRGIYATGHIGSVAIQNLTIDAQTGTESGIVAHRGTYVHLSDIDLDGNSIASSFGLIGEAGGIMEAINVTPHDFAVDVQVYANSLVQLSQNSIIGAAVTRGAGVSRGGTLSLAVGATATGNILVFPGGVLETAGISSNHISLGSVELRGADWGGEYVDVTGTITQRAGSRIAVDVLSWSGNWDVYGGYIRTPGAKSYIAPATKSTVVAPLFFHNDDYNLDVDSTFEIVSSAGSQVAENIGHQSYAVGADGVTLPFICHGRVNTLQLNATAARANLVLPTTQTGRLAGTPIPDGTIFIIFGTGGACTIVEATTADISGGSVVLGSAAGNELAITCVWSQTFGKWLVGKFGAR